MPRGSRQYSESGYYHIIVRGVNRQDIFLDDEDRERFLDTLKRFINEMGIGLIAYCLMDNHVHLLMNTGEQIGMFMKKIASSYVYYFNRKYDRIGHLFQDRYKSEAVDTDEYLLVVARYILQNPQKAGICKADKYQWSSWKETMTGSGLCATGQLCELVGSRQLLMAFLRMSANDDCLDTDTHGALKEEEARRLLHQITGLDNLPEMAGLPKEKQREAVRRAKKEGLSVRQIARLTGLNRNMVQRM